MRAVPLLILASTAGAQEAPPAPEPKPQAAPEPKPQPAPEPAPRREASLSNVRVDLTLTDQAGSREPVKKTMTLTLADGERGSVRSRPQIMVGVANGGKQFWTLPLNVDARPLLTGGKVKLLLLLEYSSIDQQPGTEGPPKADVNFSGQVVLDSGRPMVVAEAADPVSDRRVTVEVKATILR
jgi:hypothetical protein